MAKSTIKNKVFLAIKVLSVATLLAIALYGVISPPVIFLAAASLSLAGPGFLLVLLAVALLHTFVSSWWRANWHKWVKSQATAEQINKAWQLFGLLLIIAAGGFALHNMIMLSAVVGTSVLFLGGPALVLITAIVWGLYLFAFPREILAVKKVFTASTASQTAKAKPETPFVVGEAHKSKAAVIDTPPREAKKPKDSAAAAAPKDSQAAGTKDIAVPVSDEKRAKSAEFAPSLLSSALPIYRQTLETKNDGDCAIHAILAENKKGVIFCKDAQQKRAQIEKAIRESKLGDPINQLAVEGIKDLLMSGRGVGPYSEDLLIRYQAHLRQQSKLKEKLAMEFEAELKEFPKIVACINSGHKLNASASLCARFNDAVNRDKGKLQRLVFSLPSLRRACVNYSDFSNIGQDWEFLMQNAISEYATFIGRKGQWLLPSELALVAHVFNKTVVYYPGPTLDAHPMELNPGQRDRVMVQFDGRVHYERVVEIPAPAVPPADRIGRAFSLQSSSMSLH